MFLVEVTCVLAWVNGLVGHYRGGGGVLSLPGLHVPSPTASACEVCTSLPRLQGAISYPVRGDLQRRQLTFSDHYYLTHILSFDVI